MIGECKKCGECCKYIAIILSPLIDDLLWAEAHDIIIKKDKKNIVGFIPIRCKYLNDRNLCDIYENRPLPCKIFPKEEQLHLRPEKCRYYA